MNKRVLGDQVGPNEAIELVGGHKDDFEPLVEALNRAVKPPP